MQLFPLLFRSLPVWPGSFFKFCFCFPDCEGHKQIIAVKIVSRSIFLMFYSGSFRSSKVILGLWSILVQREQGWVWVFGIWVFLFPNTIGWRGCPFSGVCFGIFCDNQECVGSLMELSSVPLPMWLFLVPVPCCFGYCGSIAFLQIRLGDISGLVLTVQKFFSCLGSFVLWNFRIFF